jgi:hypothetical protein
MQVTVQYKGQLTKTTPRTNVDKKGFDDEGVNKHPGMPGTAIKRSNNRIQARRNRKENRKHTFKLNGFYAHKYSR